MTEHTNTDTDQPSQQFYTFAEACEVLNVDKATLRKALDEGRIPFIEVGPKSVRIPVEGLRDLWASSAEEETQ